MTEPFQTWIRSLADAELVEYLGRFEDYRVEAVKAALAEAQRRNLALPDEERARIRSGLKQREAVEQAQLNRGFVAGLGSTFENRLTRIRQITGGILGAGLGSALLVWSLADPGPASPSGFRPEDSKKYLRELEVLGGKVNLLATQIRGAWNSFWQGRNLAWTLAILTILLALGFWFIATRRARALETFGNGAGDRRT